MEAQDHCAPILHFTFQNNFTALDFNNRFGKLVSTIGKVTNMLPS
jgi:hypothetical protein